MFDKIKKIIKKPNKEKEEKLRSEIEEYGGVEKKDVFAMIASAYMVFIPIALGLLLLIALVAWLFLGGCS